MPKMFFDKDMRLEEALGLLRDNPLVNNRTPLIVRIVENPAYSFLGKNLFLFPGAMTVNNHDVVHVVLDRGFEPSDESYVIGFTMASTGKMGGISRAAYAWIARNIYPTPYRFSQSDLHSFDLGLYDGQLFSRNDLSIIHEDDYAAWPIIKIRQTFLKDAYMGYLN